MVEMGKQDHEYKLIFYFTAKQKPSCYHHFDGIFLTEPFHQKLYDPQLYNPSNHGFKILQASSFPLIHFILLSLSFLAPSA